MFFLNLMAEVSCVQLFNVMEPAAETLCDSCSLLKICTRELFSWWFCLCLPNMAWWLMGEKLGYEVFLLKWHARRFLKGQRRAGTQHHNQTRCPSQEALRWSLFFSFNVMRYTSKINLYSSKTNILNVYGHVHIKQMPKCNEFKSS